MSKQIQNQNAIALQHLLVSNPKIKHLSVCTLTEILLVCCTYICFIAVHIRCTRAAHKIHPYCMCAAYTKIGSAPHACHIHAHEVAHIWIHVCNMCAIVMCSTHAACKQLHTNCIHFSICLYGYACGAEPIFVYASMHAIWMYCVSSARAAYMCNMCRCACMQYVYMPNMCMKVADIYAVCMLYVCLLCMHVICTPHVLVCGMFQFLCMQHTWKLILIPGINVPV